MGRRVARLARGRAYSNAIHCGMPKDPRSPGRPCHRAFENVAWEQLMPESRRFPSIKARIAPATHRGGHDPFVAEDGNIVPFRDRMASVTLTQSVVDLHRFPA